LVISIVSITVFGFTSTECFLFLYFCFSKIVGLIVTPTDVLLSPKLERAGTNFFIEFTNDSLYIFSCAFMNLLISTETS